MNLHPVLAEKLSTALEPVAPTRITQRDARLPAVPGKAHAVIGMRRPAIIEMPYNVYSF
jgi:hypothetical protein